MSDWICPECGGGFPDEMVIDITTRTPFDRCPWCGKEMAGWQEQMEESDG